MDLKCIRNNNAQLYLERICNLKNISRLVNLKKKIKIKICSTKLFSVVQFIKV